MSAAPDMFGVRKDAEISPCGRYRTWLTREWDARCWKMPFVMLNPSIADADIDDPTIRRCMGFARRERYGGIVVANLYSLRATNPAELRTADYPVGPGNEAALYRLAKGCVESAVPIVCAWGVNGAERGSTFIVAKFRTMGCKLVCLGKTAQGAPRHPLYVASAQPLEPFP